MSKQFVFQTGDEPVPSRQRRGQEDRSPELSASLQGLEPQPVQRDPLWRYFCDPCSLNCCYCLLLKEGLKKGDKYFFAPSNILHASPQAAQLSLHDENQLCCTSVFKDCLRTHHWLRDRKEKLRKKPISQWESNSGPRHLYSDVLPPEPQPQPLLSYWWWHKLKRN